MAAFIPLYDSCGTLLNEIYDNIDGSEDGQASVLNDLRVSCLEVPRNVWITALESYNSRGLCSTDQLDEVAVKRYILVHSNMIPGHSNLEH